MEPRSNQDSENGRNPYLTSYISANILNPGQSCPKLSTTRLALEADPQSSDRTETLETSLQGRGAIYSFQNRATEFLRTALGFHS